MDSFFNSRARKVHAYKCILASPAACVDSLSDPRPLILQSFIRQALFRFSCTSLGADSTFFTARPVKAAAVAPGLSDKDAAAATETPLALVVALWVLVPALALAAVLAVKEKKENASLTVQLRKQGQELTGA